MTLRERIWYILGLDATPVERNYAARRDMLMVGIISIPMMLYTAMLLFCLFTETPCPIEGFDRAAYRNADATIRYKVMLSIAFFGILALGVCSQLYLRKKLVHPRWALCLAMLFAFVSVQVFAMSGYGLPLSYQVVMFASLQFLMSGLLIFTPMATVLYFSVTFTLFWMMLSGSHDFLTRQILVLVWYLAILDVVVSWVVYWLHRRMVIREIAISDQSRRDELTGAKNRHYLRDDFSSFVGHRVFMMFCDIDNFKRYNDEYSHEIGDRLLQTFFFALREAFGDECTYRYGGDEFLVVSPEFGEREFLQKVEKVCEQLESTTIENEPMPFTFSGGYVWGIPGREDAGREMLHSADNQLLIAKRAGKNRVVGIQIESM